MNTIESLINASKKVYVRMCSDEVCRRYFALAEREGFLFGGENPTDKHPSDLIAVLPDKRLCVLSAIECVQVWQTPEQKGAKSADRTSPLTIFQRRFFVIIQRISLER